MKLVSDHQFNTTINSVKHILEQIFLSTQNIKNTYSKEKIILISLIPTFAFKQLIIYVALGEYLRKKYHYNVKYLMDDKALNHCDMINMNSGIDREFLCFRCLKATQTFTDLSPHVLFTTDLLSSNTSKNTSFTSQYALALSTTRFCGTLSFEHYTKLSQENLDTMGTITDTLMQKYSLSTFITLHHNSIYSLSSMEQHFEKHGVKCINLDQGAFKKNSISFFTKFGNYKIKQDILKSLLFDEKKRKKITHYLHHRTQVLLINEKEQALSQYLQSKKSQGKKIAAIFPNVIEDADWLEYHNIFNNLVAWLLETVKFLLENDFHIVIKAHPAEIWWGVQKSALDYVKEQFPVENISFIKNTEDISSYTFLEHIDIVSVYTGTLLLECAYKHIPVIPGGSSYITKNSFWKELTKEEYFSYLLNPSKLTTHIKSTYENLLRLAYIDFFCRDISLSFLDTSLNYPNVDLSKVLSSLDLGTKEQAFELVHDLISHEHINIETYIKELEIN